MATMEKLREALTEVGGECGLPAALEAMGERWSFLILRGAFNGLHHFEEYQSELGIARNILSNRLGRLVGHGILTKDSVAEDRRKMVYSLTEKGLDLLPAMVSLRQWGERWGTGIPSSPVLVDERDHLPIRTVAIQAHDGRSLRHHDLRWCRAEEITELGSCVETSR